MVVPRTDPPVGIRGLPTVDLLFSGLFGTSQFDCLEVEEKLRVYLGGGLEAKAWFMKWRKWRTRRYTLF
jgi:hypothetical protein